MSSVKEEKDEYFDVDDGNSVGGDSGFSTGEDDKNEVLKKKDSKQETNDEIVKLVQLEPTTIEASSEEEEKQELAINGKEEGSVLYRLASLPIIQDSYLGAQKIVRQHTVGQRALDFAETQLQTVYVSAQAYENKPLIGQLFSGANSLGNRSLDLLERQFPIISSPTADIIQPLMERLDHARGLLQEPKLDQITMQFERLLDAYLPAEQEEEIKEHGIQRLIKVIHILSDRITKKTMSKIKASKEEEQKMQNIVKDWITEKAKRMLFTEDQIELHSDQLQSLHKFAQTELEKVRQELNKQDKSHMERAKSIWNLSRNDIILPLFQKSSFLFYRKQSAPVA
ncbi:hypothetical protein G6F37_003572 [Rhizopus arrhizus]|nr:hypothetical protein G6F38_007782 [Rhizopus arrhizus]KAG1160880.1 hypothetical protein G6F37_003572 [Rhizopus arrhizus]